MLSAALLELTGVTAQQTCSIIDTFLEKYLEASLSRYVLFFKKMLAIKSIIDISKCFYEPPWYQNTLPKWYKVKVNFTVNVKLSRQFFRKSILSRLSLSRYFFLEKYLEVSFSRYFFWNLSYLDTSILNKSAAQTCAILGLLTTRQPRADAAVSLLVS